MVVFHGGKQCSCGRKGCIETYASASALVRKTGEAMKAHPESLMNLRCPNINDVSGALPFECAKEGDEVAQTVVDNISLIQEKACLTTSISSAQKR